PRTAPARSPSWTTAGASAAPRAPSATSRSPTATLSSSRSSSAAPGLSGPWARPPPWPTRSRRRRGWPSAPPPRPHRKTPTDPEIRRTHVTPLHSLAATGLGPTFILAVVIISVVVIFFGALAILFAARYKKVGPNEVLVI